MLRPLLCAPHLNSMALKHLKHFGAFQGRILDYQISSGRLRHDFPMKLGSSTILGEFLGANKPFRNSFRTSGNLPQKSLFFRTYSTSQSSKNESDKSETNSSEKRTKRAPSFAYQKHKMVDITQKKPEEVMGDPLQSFPFSGIFWKVSKIILVVGGTVVLLLLALSPLMMDKYLPNIIKQFENGECPPPRVKPEELLPRAALVSQISALLQKPNIVEKAVFEVVGEEGTGKTSLVRMAIKGVGGKGIVYLRVPQDVSEFGEVLEKAIGFEYERNPGFGEKFLQFLFDDRNGFSEIEPDRSVRRMRPYLQKLSERYIDKHFTIPILVIDDAQRLEEEVPDSLQLLINMIDSWKPSPNLRLILVKTVPPQVPFLDYQSSSPSPLLKNPIRIPPLSEIEVKEYLEKKGVDAKDVSVVVNDFGARNFHALNEITKSLKDGKTATELRKECLSFIASQLKEEEKPTTTTLFSTPGGALNVLEFAKIVPDPIAQKELLLHRYFALQPSKVNIVFYSPLMRDFFKSKLVAPESPKK